MAAGRAEDRTSRATALSERERHRSHPLGRRGSLRPSKDQTLRRGRRGSQKVEEKAEEKTKAAAKDGRTEREARAERAAKAERA